MAVVRVVSYAFLLSIGAACVLSAPDQQSAVGADSHRTDAITVFLSGNELGALKPCGCSGGQLGGLDRRGAVFQNAAESERIIIDTGSFVENESEQNRIKFQIVARAFQLLKYDLVNLTEKDVQFARNAGVLANMASLFGVITSQPAADVNLPAKFTKKFLLNCESVVVTVAAFDHESTPAEKVGELFGESAVKTANILILKSGDPNIIDAIAKTGAVDCIVCPADSDEPRILGDPNANPLVLSMGKYGKYVARLVIEPLKGQKKPKLKFTSIPVREELPQQQTLVELYKTYQYFVQAADLLGKNPRFSLPDCLEYTGSESCNKICHEYELEKWSAKPHAKAYATLEKVGSQYDPECVICHVVGLEYVSGFVSEDKTPHLKNVGCENCHGPGSVHNQSLGREKTTGPMSSCTDCHTPEHSGDFAGNEKLYREKIVHWREPNAAGTVK